MKRTCWDTRATDSIIKSDQKDTETSILGFGGGGGISDKFQSPLCLEHNKRFLEWRYWLAFWEWKFHLKVSSQSRNSEFTVFSIVPLNIYNF